MTQKAIMHFSLRNIWILALGLILAVSVFLTQWAPWQARVKAVSPQNNSEMGGTVRITIQFAQAMQADSAARYFSITPQVAGKAEWDGNTFTWIPDNALTEGIYTARLATGALAADGRSIQRDMSWTFHVRAPEVAFLSPGAGGGNEVWAANLDQGEPRQVTDTDGKVVNFAPSADGNWILYAQENERKGIDLWQIQRDGSKAAMILDCGTDRCSSPSWAPDGNKVAFSRESSIENGTYDVPRLWILTIGQKQAKPYYPSDYPMQGAGPSWSPNGRYIAALDASIGGIRITDLKGSEDALLETTLDRVGHWSPDGNRVVFASEEVVDGNFGTRLLIMDLQKRKVDPFLPQEFEQADDSTPYFSPDGARLAVSRRLPGGWVSRQIWLMDVDGKNPTQLTSDETITYTVLGWDAYGKRILFQRAQLGSSDVIPEIGYVDMETGDVKVLGKNATQPAWLY